VSECDREDSIKRRSWPTANCQTTKKIIDYDFELRHPRCVGSITKNFCVLHIQSNTTIFHLVVQ